MADTYQGVWSKSGSDAIYTIKNGDTVEAKIVVSGLKSGVATTDLTVSSDDYTEEGTITLKAAALGDSDVTMSVTNASGTDIENNYTFALADDVTTSDKAKLTGTWINTSGTATYTGGKEAHYTANGNTVTYNAAGSAALATITGLKNDVSAEALAEATDNSKSTDDEGGKGTINLKAAMFKDSSVVLTSDKYTFGALPDETDDFKTSAPDAIYAWDALATMDSSTLQKAEYKKTVGAYYTLTNNKKIAYHDAVTTTDATLTNIESGFTGALPAASENNVIELPEGVLNKDASKPTTLANTGGLNYTLALAEAVPKTNTVTNVNRWSVAEGAKAADTTTQTYTATYATYKPEFFGLASNKLSVNYTGQTKVDNLATITGLIGLNETSALQEDAPTGITMPASGSTAITLATALLHKPTAESKQEHTVSVTGTGGYTLAVADADAWAEKAVIKDNITDYWTVANADTSKSEPADTKTAIYQYDTKAGYKANDDANATTLTYTQSENIEIFRISGLKISAPTASLTADPARYLDSDLDGITNPTTDGKVIELGQDALYTDATKAAKLTINTAGGFEGYTLAYEPSNIAYSYANKGTNIKGDDIAEINLWTATANTDASGVTTYGSATLAAYKPEHFSVGDDKDTITYVPLALVDKNEDGTNRAALAVITGLNISEAIELDEANTKFPKTETEMNTLGIATTFDSTALTTVTLDNRILPAVNKHKVELTTGDCELAIDTTSAQKVVEYSIEDTPKWVTENVAVSGSDPASVTAKYQRTATAGYTVGKQDDDDTKNNQITYTDSTPIVVATITGLKTGTENTAAGAIDGITVTAPTDATTPGTFELANKVLQGTTELELNESGNHYTGADKYKGVFKLALNDDAKTKVSNVTVAKSGENTGDVKGDISGYQFESDDAKKIISVATTESVKLAEISGLNDKATTDITVKNGVITLNRDNLTASDSELTTKYDNKEVAAIVDEYTLKLKGNATAKAYKADTAEVSVEDGKAKVTGTLDYYVLDSSADGKSRVINYKMDEETELATIEGLADDATVDISTTDDSVILLDNDAVAGKDITLTNKQSEYKKYTLDWDSSLTDDDDFRRALNQKEIWVSDASKGTATFKKINLDYYDLAANGAKIEYKPQEDAQVYFTLAGLKKDEDALEVKTNTSSGVTSIDGITLAGQVITLTSDVLNNETVKFDAGTGYTLAYTPSTGEDSTDLPNKVTYTYTLDYSNGTATFKQGNVAYYKLNGNNTQLIYNAAKTPATTVVTVAGLSDEVVAKAADDVGVASTVANAGGKWILGYSDPSDEDNIISAVIFRAPKDEDDTTIEEKVILSDAKALNEKDVTLTNGSGFNYKLDVSSISSAITPKAANLWVKDSANYAYYAGTGAGYTLAVDGSKLNYSKATKGDGTARATITGLNSKVTIDNDGKIVNSSGDEVVTYASNTITLKKDALGANDVKFVGDAGSHTFTLDTGVPSGALTETWSEKNGTVTYTRATGAFYQLNLDSGDGYLPASTYVRYTAPVTYNVTISGLDSTKVNAAATKDGSGNITGYGGITIEAAKAKTDEVKDGDKIAFDAKVAVNGNVTVDEGLFNTTKKGDIKVASSNKRFFVYTITATPLTDSTKSNVKNSSDINAEWEINNGKATYVRKVDAGKYVSDDSAEGSDKITYYGSKKVLSTLVTINGLNKELKTFNATVAGTSTFYNKDDDLSTTNDQGYSYMITMTKDLLASTEKSKVTKVTLTNGKDGNTPMQYSFKLESGGTSAAVAVPEVQDPVWVTKKGTATLQYETTEGFTLGDAKKATYHDVITYSADKWTPIVTLTGLKNLTNAKEKEYEVGGTSAADTPNAPASIAEFALKGISASAIGVVDDNDNPVLDDNNLQKKVSTITLKGTDLLTTSAIKLKNNTKEKDWTEAVDTAGTWAYKLQNKGYQNAQFVLSMDTGLNPKSYNQEWTYKSGTATLTSGTKAGYEQKSGNTDTVNYVKEKVGVTIATISGLPKPTDKNAKEYYAVGGTSGVLCRTDANGNADLEKPAVTVSGVSIATVSGKTTATAAKISFTSDGLAPLTSGTIKAKEKYVEFEVLSGQPVYAENGGTGAWSIEKGKATLNRTVAVAGWNTSADRKSISYVPLKDKKGNDNVETLATITGLNKDLTLKTVATYNAENVTYAIKGANDATVLAAGSSLAAYKEAIGKYIEFTPGSGNGEPDGTTTLHNSVLSTSKVSIKSSTTARKYDLALASDVNDKSNQKENYWTVNGNKATFSYGTLAYYTKVEDSKLVGSDGKTKLITSINYTKAPTADVTYFTLSGLKKGAQAGTIGGTSAADQNDFYISSGVDNASTKVTGDITVTLNSTAFDTTDAKKQSSTKVAISVPKGNYKGVAKLALGTGITTAGTTDSWTAGTGKATLERNVTTSGYILSGDDKTITYGVSAKDAVNGVKQTKATTLATLNGVKAVPSATQTGTEIQIGNNQVDGKKITLKDNVNGGYALSKTATAPTVTLADERNDSLKAASAWSTPKNGKVNLLGSVTTAGYTQSDNYNINYTAAAASGAKDKNLATVTGVKSSITAMTSTTSHSVASMKGADLNNAVTVDGGGVISFSFDNAFKGTAATENTITGSAKDDTITVAGSYIAINPGKGNDLIDLGSDNNTKNSVIYASGDGNDVIVNFTEGKDKITLKNQRSVSVAWGTNDAVVTVDKGTITLKSFTGSSVTISGTKYNKNGASDLLLDDNYSMTAANDDLSSIIKADTGSYTPYQFSDSLKLTKEESFTPQIAYGSNKK